MYLLKFSWMLPYEIVVKEKEAMHHTPLPKSNNKNENQNKINGKWKIKIKEK